MIKPILIPTDRSNLAIVKKDYKDDEDMGGLFHHKENMEIVFGDYVDLKYYKCYHIILIDTKAKIVNGDLCLHLGFNRIEIWTGNQELDIQLRRKIISATNKLTIRDYKFKDGCPAKGFIGFNKSLPLLSHNSIQLLMDYHNEYKCMPESVDIEYIIDEGDKRNWYEDVPSGKYWEDIPVIPSKNNLYTNAEHKICKLNNQGGVDITIPKVEIIGKPVEDYIRAKHTQEECIGFIDGWNAVKEKFYTKEELDMKFNNIINDILCKKIGNSLRKNPNSNDISIFVTDWIGKNL